MFLNSAYLKIKKTEPSATISSMKQVQHIDIMYAQSRWNSQVGTLVSQT